MEQTLTVLVDRAREGDLLAREQIFRQHAPAIAPLLVRLLGSRGEAEDALHDTFLVAFQRLDTLRESEAIRPWLVTIAARQAQRRFRRWRLSRALGLDGGDQQALESLAAPDASPEVRAELAIVGRVVGRLPAAERLAWMLRFVEGHDLATVASACGCSLATAKRRVAAAQSKVSEVLAGKRQSHG